MAEISVDLSGVGIREVLSGLRFPTSRWQIVATAQYWGASDRFISELMQLPIREYRDLADVATTLGDRRRVQSLVWASGPRRLPAPRTAPPW
jgi:hypothetical protein